MSIPRSDSTDGGATASEAGGPPSAGVPPAPAEHRPGFSAALFLAAIGIVYGDIGTSPLYAFRECFAPTMHGAARTPENVLGVLSLVFWALALVVSAKYLFYVMRADNDGEGGILALMALALPRASSGTALSLLVIAAGLLGGGLLIGDGIITPAISVLSAVEGLGEVDERLHAVVVPLTIAILIALFALQRRGTARVGAIFGPVMLLWFLTIAILGAVQVVRVPGVLAAVVPLHAIHFFAADPHRAFLVLGAVFLVVTGGEALYADMGHFGLRPIQVDWFLLVLPCLLLNYFGQGALVLNHAEAFDSPFFALAPRTLLVPLVILSTMATVIASQAVISGVFSLARQATMLGYWPRLPIAHTSDEVEGQIYVPSVNWALLLATILLVLAFQSSASLASAYGIAVTSTMVITTCLAAMVAVRCWGWPPWVAGVVTLVFLFVDGSFLVANLSKLAGGGYVPIAVALTVYVLMSTWSNGRRLLGEYVRENLVPLDADGAPPALIHNFLHNHVLHERVVLLTVTTLPQARVAEVERLELQTLPEGFYRLRGRYGFMETPDVPDLLLRAGIPGLSLGHTTFFLGREIPLADRGGLASWRHQLFAWMARNSVNATTFFNLPPDRVMEIGYQLELR
jgi:KUP system potassium uptake protein